MHAQIDLTACKKKWGNKAQLRGDTILARKEEAFNGCPNLKISRVLSVLYMYMNKTLSQAKLVDQQKCRKCLRRFCGTNVCDNHQDSDDSMLQMRWGAMQTSM